MPTYPPLPAPSRFDLPKEPLPNPPPSVAVRALLGLRRAIQKLADAVTPAELVLFERVTNVHHTAIVSAAARHDLSDLLEAGPLSAEAIAAKKGLSADSVHRMMRALAAWGIFTLRSDGTFENNRLSRALRSGTLARTREFAIYFGSGSNLAAWSDFDHALRTGDSPFEHVHGMTVWEWFDRHPDEREIFAHLMMGITTMAAPVVATLYPWSEVTRVCDVGGGRGTLLSELLVRHPHLSGVLCDAEGVLISARELLRSRGVEDRVELTPGSFFEAVPRGADAYILKHVLHDWDDEACGRILEVVRRAMERGQKLIVVEGVVDKLTNQPMEASGDLQMMVACSGGRDRSLGELRRLLVAHQFDLERTFPYATVSILEAVAR